jgi:hypothetical protein
MVGKGMTVWIASENVSEEQREFAKVRRREEEGAVKERTF